MISPFRLNLEPAWLPALASLATLPPGALCAWQGMQPLTLPEDARQALLKEGLLEPSGAASPGFLPILNLLAAPSASLHLQLESGEKTLNYSLFFSGLDDESASLVQNGNDLALTAPARPTDLLSSLRQYTGESLLQPVTFSADLPLTEALALAALLDRSRAAILQSIISDSNPLSPSLSPQEIAAMAATPSLSSQWLLAVIRQAANLPTPPDADHFAAALLNLVNRSLITPHPDGKSYFINEAANHLAHHLLIIDTRVQLMVRRANPQGDVHRAHFIYLQSGVSSLVKIELMAGLVRLESLPAASLLDQVEYYLTRPNALPMPPIRPLTWRLGLLSGDTISAEYELTGSAKIGRGSDCEIQISDPRSSRHHAVIHLVEGGYEVNDLGSTNGTYLNHVQILKPLRLQVGDLIRIGETSLKVLGGSSIEPTAPIARGQARQPSALPDLPPVTEPLHEPAPAQAPAWLHLPPDDLPEAEAPEPTAGEGSEAEPPEPAESAPSAEPLAWLYLAEETLALPDAEEALEEEQAGAPEPAQEALDMPAEAAAEEPILGETHPLERGELPPPPMEPPEEPIQGETRQVQRRPSGQICPQCGSPCPLTARFCGNCGQQLGE